MQDIGSHTLSLGPDATIVPFGFGVIMTGYTTEFDAGINGMVGLVFKAIPDDLCERALAGEPVTAADIERMQDVEQYAQTVFLHMKDPDALTELADMATELAVAWRCHLANKEDPA